MVVGIAVQGVLQDIAEFQLGPQLNKKTDSNCISITKPDKYGCVREAWQLDRRARTVERHFHSILLGGMTPLSYIYICVCVKRDLCHYKGNRVHWNMRQSDESAKISRKKDDLGLKKNRVYSSNFSHGHLFAKHAHLS